MQQELREPRGPRYVRRNANAAVWFTHWWDAAGTRRYKQVPVDVQDEGEARRWVEGWWGSFSEAGFVDVRTAPAVVRVEHPTIEDLHERWEEAVALEKDAHPEARTNAERLMRVHVLGTPLASKPI